MRTKNENYELVMDYIDDYESIKKIATKSSLTDIVQTAEDMYRLANILYSALKGIIALKNLIVQFKNRKKMGLEANQAMPYIDMLLKNTAQVIYGIKPYTGDELEYKKFKNALEEQERITETQFSQGNLDRAYIVPSEGYNRNREAFLERYNQEKGKNEMPSRPEQPPQTIVPIQKRRETSINENKIPEPNTRNSSLIDDFMQRREELKSTKSIDFKKNLTLAQNAINDMYKSLIKAYNAMLHEREEMIKSGEIEIDDIEKISDSIGDAVDAFLEFDENISDVAAIAEEATGTKYDDTVAIKGLGVLSTISAAVSILSGLPALVTETRDVIEAKRNGEEISQKDLVEMLGAIVGLLVTILSVFVSDKVTSALSDKFGKYTQPFVDKISRRLGINASNIQNLNKVMPEWVTNTYGKDPSIILPPHLKSSYKGNPVQELMEKIIQKIIDMITTAINAYNVAEKGGIPDVDELEDLERLAEIVERTANMGKNLSTKSAIKYIKYSTF